MPELSVREISRRVGGELSGEAERPIRGIAPLDTAGPQHLSFVAKPRDRPYVPSTSAGAVLLPRGMEVQLPAWAAAIRVDDVQAALAVLLPLLHPEPAAVPGVHPTALIGEGTELGEGIAIGPHAVIGRGVRIGDHARIGAQVVIGDGCHVGAHSVIHPHATLYADVRLGERSRVQSGACLGPDGFGFAFVQGAHRKIPQVGGVRAGDDLEVGANSTIDRGSVGHTILGSGCGIAALVHVGHNARLGDRVALDDLAGVAGSAVIGNDVAVGGQVAVMGHLAVGDGVRIGRRGGITHDVLAGADVAGTPARPRREALRMDALLFRLPRLMKRLQALERAVLGRGGEK